MAPFNTDRMKVAAVVSFYMGAALVMVFVNKAVLNNVPNLPFIFLLIQMVIAVALLHATAAMNEKVNIPKVDFETTKKLFPVISISIIGLVFNTLCLRGVEASFFQIARGLVLPLTIAVSSAHSRVSPQKSVILCAALVSFGFMFGVSPSSSVPVTAIPSTLSLFYGVLSSLFIAFHAVLVKTSLPHCNNSTIELAWWTNAGSAILILPLIIIRGEISTLYTLIYSDNWDSRVFVWGSLTTGVFGFLLCVAGLLSIKVTSPVTHMFSSAARSVLQTVLGVWIFNDTLTANRVTSIGIILGGTILYTWVKSREQKPAAQAPKDIERGHTIQKDEVKDEKIRA